MSGDSDSHTYTEGRQGGTPPRVSEPKPRLHPAKQAFSKAPPWVSKFVARLRGSAFTAILRKHLLLTVILVLLLVPVGAVILGYITRPATGTAGQTAGVNTNPGDSNTGDKKAKPSPGKPFLSATQTPPPSVASPPPPQELQTQPPVGLTPHPQSPLSVAPGGPSPLPNSTAPPPSAGTAAKFPYTPVVYSARHDKHFGESCSGQLTLDGSGLLFKCSDDPRGSVQVALADIESVDSNGIRLISGKKYHFSIAGMAKDSEQALFADWLSRVR